jgi:flagellar biogenesis protein FliO
MTEIELIKAIAALGFVAALIYFFAFLAKKYLPFTEQFSKTTGSIKIKEIKMIDNHRKVILITRENKEYLILLGVNSDIVLDNNVANENSSKKKEKVEKSSK